MQGSLGLAQTSNRADVGTDGRATYRDGNESDHIQTMRLDLAYQFGERWQAGIGLPVKRRERETRAGQNENSTGLGDISASTAWEFLPETSYSIWKPRGFAFAKLTAPTGRSIYEAQERLGTDGRGGGFWSPGLGLAFYKLASVWDFLGVVEGHHGLARSFGDKRVTPGWGAMGSVGAGVSPGQGSWRVGASISPYWEQGRDVQDSLGKRQSTSSYYWEGQLAVNYAPAPEQAVAVTWADQTLWGPARNTAVGQTFALSFIQRLPY